MKIYILPVLLVCFAALRLNADIVVDGNGVTGTNTMVRVLPDQVGGVMISPYADTTQTANLGFTNTITFQNAFDVPHPAIVRLSTYPDYHKPADVDPASIEANYDPKIDLLVAHGAMPLFLEYTGPNDNLGATGTFNGVVYSSGTVTGMYVDAAGQNLMHDHVTDGNLATNVAFVVKHYLGLDNGHYSGTPGNQKPIDPQYWEIGNEPDGAVTGGYSIHSNYTATSTPPALPNFVDYCTQYNSVDAMLRNTSDGKGGTLRSHVILCGPGMSIGYNAPSTDPNAINQIFWFWDYFLKHCAATGACDIVTYHAYSRSATTYPASSLLNDVHIEALNAAYNYATPPVAEAGLQLAMANDNVPSNVGTGITEFNTSSTATGTPPYLPHTITQGLWTAIAQHYMMYNYHSVFASAPNSATAGLPHQPLGYQNLLNTGFIFDGNQILSTGYTYFSAVPPITNSWSTGDYNFWALYIADQMTGCNLLRQTYTTTLPSGTVPPLLCTASQDGTNLYVEVINRGFDSSGNPMSVPDKIDLNNFATILGQGTVYTLSSTTNNLPPVVPPVGSAAGTTPGGKNISLTNTFTGESITVYKFPLGVPSAGLVGYYQFNQNTNDTSGTGNNGTPTTGFTYSTNSAAGSAHSGVFDGSTQWVRVPDNASLDITGNLTVGAWVNPTALPHQIDVIAKNFNTGYRMALTSSGQIQFILGGYSLPLFSTQTIPTSTWSHIGATVTFNGNGTATVKFYVNGIPDPSPQTITLASIQEGTGDLVLGSGLDTAYDPLQGLLDQVTIYNRALSDTEMTQLAQ